MASKTLAENMDLSRSLPPRERLTLFLPAAIAIVWLGGFAVAAPPQSVVMRTSSGRFLQLAEGRLTAQRLLPGDDETFQLIADANGGTLWKSRDGHSVVSSGVSTAAESIRLIQLDGNRAALQVDDGSFVVLDPRRAGGDDSLPTDRPRPDQTAELFRLGHVPAVIQTALARLLRAEVVDEIGDKPYEKVRTRKKRRYIELPAPTIREPKRTKRHRVLSVTEEYHIRAQLTGPPQIRVVDMPYLQGYYEAAAGSLMFRIDAKLPLEGRVRYKIPDLLSASTGFRTSVEITATGEIRLQQSGQGTSLKTPELIDLSVAVGSLDVSNDALSLVREPLEDFVNEELRDQRERIREKANRSIRKAIDQGDFRIPLLEWFVLPRLR